MKHLVVIFTVVILTVFDESWGQNRGNSRYSPPDEFLGDITRAPRHNPTRRAGLRRQRPTKAPELPSVEEDVKSYQPPEIPSRTTARRVPQRNNLRQVAPSSAPPVLIEEPIPLYPSSVSEIPQGPPAKTEGRLRGTRRRRPKKRRKPQTVLPKVEDGEEKQSVPENNKGVISELINEDKKRTAVFHDNTQLRNAPPNFDSNQNFQPEKTSWDSNITPEQPQRNPVAPYFRPRSSTNRLPLEDSNQDGNSEYLDTSADISNVNSPNEYIPKEPPSAIRNEASYVPILPPIRTPSDGSSRLPTDVYPSAQDKESTRQQSSDRNRPYQAHSARTSGTDPNHAIRNTGARPIHNVIPQSDEIGTPVRGYSEVRLPEEKQPLLSSEYVSSNFNPSEDLPVPMEPDTSDESEELSKPTNRLPNPSEVHYDSEYPKVSENSRRIVGRRQEPVVDNVRKTQTSYSTPRREIGTKPQDFDNDAEVDRRQASRYRPPLQRAGSRYRPDSSDDSTRTNRQQPSAITSSRGRSSSRYQPSTDDDTVAPIRTRNLRTNSEEVAKVPSRTQSSSTSQSTYRTRKPQRYTLETIEKAPRTRSRQQMANANASPTDARYTPSSPAYVPIDEIIRNEQRAPSHSSRGHTSLSPPSHIEIDDKPEENAPIRNTLRSRPQYEVRNTEPVNSYEESNEDSRNYNYEYQQPRGRTNQRTSVTREEQPHYKYEQPPNHQQNRPEPHYEPPQRTRSRQQPQYQTPNNPRTDYRETNLRQNKPSSRQQARPINRNTEAPAPRSRSSGRSDFKCPDSFGFFADPVQCDKYYECRNGTAIMNLCNDGLAFNEVSAPKFLRCDSLRDVDCKSRSELQEPQPTKNCPRRFGLFPHESDCTKFWNCVDGAATEVQCPPGLTYNDALGTCDWADLVKSSCKTEDLLGFTCPEPTTHDLLDGVYTRYPHPDNCQLHFTCIKGADGLRRPRMLSCNEGLVFDPETAACKRPEEVPGCEEFYGPRSPPKRKPAARQPVHREPEPEEILEEPTPRPRRRGSYRRARN